MLNKSHTTKNYDLLNPISHGIFFPWFQHIKKKKNIIWAGFIIPPTKKYTIGSFMQKIQANSTKIRIYWLVSIYIKI